MKKISILTILICLLMSCQSKISSESPANNNNLESIKTITPTQPIEYSPDPSAIAISRVDSRLGTVEFWGRGQSCLVIQNSELVPGDKIEVILLGAESPQEVFSGEVVEKKSCRRSGESTLEVENATDYLLKPSLSDDAVNFGPGVGIVNPLSKAKVVKGIVSIDIDGDGKDEYFRSCSGPESFLLAVWKGKPLIGKRIWHSQYYLKYDAVKTCKKKDWEGIPEDE